MKHTRYLIIFLIWYLSASCVSTPLPNKITITPPSSDIPKELAAFSGGWKGIFFGGFEVTLIVQTIKKENVHLIYSWGENMAGPGGYYRVLANVISGPGVEWVNKDNYRFTFVMNDDLESLTGILYNPKEKRNYEAKLKRYKLR